ncbi:triphosphoribosyl-dephospho-CoA synthase CitG [Isobaculum melis]|uniref:Probable 2-(5''-triphosphoribosyl)-3'-dephosphocoenzyme-A synthase n=1 Tax=Isobaculum melis TaxID=142588 RepID=A0A1H9TMC1_9LACT|nr:triphosphoribosyl-dephospho-CoA synthase CitG [Isobaculum melis]SER97743.1 triphosphoribosyl-dephospho-CoA synthase [Isobaculum melis]
MKNVNQLAQQLAQFAQQGLLYEAALSPKPGLVDATNAGAHDDMDLFTFLDSSVALYPGFINYAQAGLQHDGTLTELFHKIRPIGIAIEKEMNLATNGVNTHKGAIFSFGILLAAAGCYLKREKLVLSTPLTATQTEDIFKLGQAMVTESLAKDFIGLEQKNPLTNGEKLYLKYGLMGIRGEALNGYPLIHELALPYLRKKATSSLSVEDKLLTTLMYLISTLEDSNLVSRGGIAGLNWAKSAATAYLEHYSPQTVEGKKQLQLLNQEFIERHLSPGGSADLLALTIFIAKLEQVL